MASIALRWLSIALLFYFSLLTANGRKVSSANHESFVSISTAISHKNLSERNQEQHIRPVFPQNDASNNYKERFVEYGTYDDDAAYYGVQAKFSVWSFPVGTDQHSLTFMTVINGHSDNGNAIQVGWHIHPHLYNDYDPHFYIAWTADNYNNTGCFNLLCPGFVLSKNTTSIPGAKLWPLSQYGGTQYYGHYKIFKDSKTGDWWIYEGANTYSNPVGYFPQSLFTNLAHNASRIQMGGYVFALNNGITPPMGSGHDASEGYGKAADFEDIRFVKKTGESKAPISLDFQLYYLPLKCYSGSRMKIKNGKGSFYYGGPGNC